ncbi:hypothetical protein GW17_00051205 [Ensete ventricosum]|nr:hypothetical protein GW17_00051205 [Ensete ventricosum]
MRSLVLLLDHVEVTPCQDVKHSRVPSCIELRCEMSLDRVEVIDLSWINMWTHMAAKSSQSERGTMPILVSRRGYASKVRRFAVVLPFVSHIDKCQRRDGMTISCFLGNILKVTVDTNRNDTNYRATPPTVGLVNDVASPIVVDSATNT